MPSIILFEPQIPPNTGNVVRTCAALGFDLILVKPLGFSINEKAVRRAGLDYWDDVSIQVIDDLESYLEQTDGNFYFFSSKAKKTYWDAPLSGEGIHLIFGSETSGLPERYHQRWPERFLTIPMEAGIRCLNLASSVTAVACEARRQASLIQA